jgi:Tol biopolymer transport system component/DNA-binding winged helix-turn-helix (wHTH) protein
MTQKTRHFYEFGRFRIDSTNRLLMKDGELVPLKPKVVETLLALIESHGQVLNKRDLMDRVWPNISVTAGNLTTNINLLRQAIGDDFIQTIPRRGYRFVGEVLESDAEPRSRDPVIEHAPRDSDRGNSGDRLLRLDAEFRPVSEKSSLPTTELGATRRNSWKNDLSAASREPVDEDRITTRRLLSRLVWVGTAAVVVIVAISAGLGLLRRFRTPERPFMVTNIPAETSEYRDAYGARVAPDGNRIAFLARAQSSGKRFIFVRELSTEESDPIEESAGDDTPFFWSQDGLSLYFVAGGFLKRKRIGHETIETVAACDGAPRGTVNRDGVVLLGSTKGILRVLPDGRTSQITISMGGGRHTLPYFLPDGVTFLFLAISHPAGGEPVKVLYSGRLDAPNTVRQIGPISSRVEWNAGNLLYARDRALYARPWSLNKQSFAGEEVLVVPHVYSNVSNSDADFSVARNGLLVVKDEASPSRFERVRPGTKSIPIPWQGQVVGVTVARDREIAVLASRETPGRTDLWAWDPNDHSRRKLTPFGTNTSPVLNVTGDQVYYAADRKKFVSIYRMSIATGKETLVREADTTLNPRGLSSDGELLLYASYRQQDSDLFCINLKTRRVTAIASTPNTKEGETGRFSPDGTKVVYVSDVSGEQQVYITPFPPDGSPALRISPTGGWRARWSSDGTKIYYLQRRSLNEYEVKTHAVRELYRADFDISHMEPTAHGEFLVVIAPVEPANRIVSNWRDAVGR